MLRQERWLLTANIYQLGSPVQCLQLNITCFSVTLFYNFLFFYEIFRTFKDKWLSYACRTAGPGQFFWKFSLLSSRPRYTDISISNCNTVYTTSCGLTTTGFTELLLKDTPCFCQSTCTFRTVSVIFCNLHYYSYNFI